MTPYFMSLSKNEIFSIIFKNIFSNSIKLPIHNPFRDYSIHESLFYYSLIWFCIWYQYDRYDRNTPHYTFFLDNIYMTHFLVFWIMFEQRSTKQRIIIYALIAFFVTLLLAIIHDLQGWPIEMILIVAAIEYVCIFYILYLPLKYQRK